MSIGIPAELKIWHLKQCPLFAALDPGELGAIFDSAKLVFCDSSEAVPPASAGEPSIWIVKRGHVKLTYVDGEGRQGIVMILSPGDIFGSILPDEKAVFGEHCEAMTSVCLARISRARFDSLLRRHPDLSYQINKASFSRIVRLQMRMADLLMRPVEQRLALTLLDLAKEFGKRQEGGAVELDIALSHRDLGQLIGSSREMVTHTAKRLRDAGLVEMEKRRIVLLDPAGLEALAARE